MNAKNKPTKKQQNDAHKFLMKLLETQPNLFSASKTPAKTIIDFCEEIIGEHIKWQVRQGT